MEADYAYRIAITPEEPLPDESSRINRMLQSGRFTHIHLRHPAASRREMLEIIEGVDQRFHSRLRLHGHFDLVNEFNLGGLHLNRRCPAAPPYYSGLLSRSCHSMAELSKAAGAAMEYATLSPVFDSLSKPGYRAAFSSADLQAVKELSPFPVIALGGVTPLTVPQLKPYGFAGYAMLTAAWH